VQSQSTDLCGNVVNLPRSPTSPQVALIVARNQTKEKKIK